MGRKFRLRGCRKDAVLIACLIASVVVSDSVEARLISTDLSLPAVTNHTAIHLPTGCVARIVLDERRFISAMITDPDCLPDGISARAVPGSRLDFEVIQLPKF